MEESELAPLQEDPQAEAPVVETATVAPAQEPDEPNAVELTPGERYVPLSALKAVRQQAAELKPLAEKAAQLEQELAASRPVLEFLKANPHILQPQQPPAPVEAKPSAPDASVVEYARRFDLYTVEGQPDVARAQAIIEDNRRIAREEAEAALAPVHERADLASATANLTWLSQQTDGDGKPIEKQFLDAVVSPLIQGKERSQSLKMLADPQVMQMLKFTALGLQNANRKTPAPAPVVPPPLQTEASGGGTAYTMTEAERRMARMAGRSEKDWSDSAKRFKPGSYNVLE